MLEHVERCQTSADVHLSDDSQSDGCLNSRQMWKKNKLKTFGWWMWKSTFHRVIKVTDNIGSWKREKMEA